MSDNLIPFPYQRITGTSNATPTPSCDNCDQPGAFTPIGDPEGNLCAQHYIKTITSLSYTVDWEEDETK